MNVKYAKKANPNPNEPNAAWPKRPASESLAPARRAIHILAPDSRLLPFLSAIALATADAFFSGPWSLFSGLLTKTNPIFSRPKPRYQYQKHRNACEKWRQKNETNPILTEA